jgi:hypothetical protein
MSKISPDGFVKTDIFSDLSIFNFNNIYIGQYAAKINKGSNNLIIGNNAGKIGIGLNNSIFIGANAGSEYLDRDKVISIGDIQVSNNKIDTESINIGYNIRDNSNGIVITNDKQHPQLFLNSNGSLDIGIFNQGITETSIGSYNSNLKANINIGNSNISTVNNSIVIGNAIRNNKFSLNIDDLLCKDDGGIYIGCGIYKDLPIILGSSSNNYFTSNNLDMGNNFISSVFKIKNDTNTSISFITNTNQNIIYNLPLAPNYEYSFLSTDANGNLEWVELSKAVITDINTTEHIICNNLESANLTGDGSLITNINISNNTTDNLKEGLNNLYLNIHSISKIFYSYLQSFSTNDIKNGNSNNYFSFDKYSSNFYSNLRLITTDDIRGGRFYSSNDYYSNSSNYLLTLNTDFIKEGVSNLYYNPSNINTDFIKEGSSNLYYNESLIKINISNTDYIREGSSNLYYNQSLLNSNIRFINTDFLKQGNSNLYVTDYNIYNYFNSNIPTTDFIIQGTSNDYFSNINNQDKYSLISDKIREGSNIYYKFSNQITDIIYFNTNTELYKEGTSNFYYYENRGINDYLKVISSNITTDNFNNGTSKKFIKNNFYNNNLQIAGFLKANNVNDLDNGNLRDNYLEPKIGPLTEVYQVYDFESLFVKGRLSNIEISYTAHNTIPVVNNVLSNCTEFDRLSVIGRNSNMEISYISENPQLTVPFIIIDNKVGINNSNPRYPLDVSGIINTGGLYINNISIETTIDNMSNNIRDTINNITNTINSFININNYLLTIINQNYCKKTTFYFTTVNSYIYDNITYYTYNIQLSKFISYIQMDTIKLYKFRIHASLFDSLFNDSTIRECDYLIMISDRNSELHVRAIGLPQDTYLQKIAPWKVVKTLSFDYITYISPIQNASFLCTIIDEG